MDKKEIITYDFWRAINSDMPDEELRKRFLRLLKKAEIMLMPDVLDVDNFDQAYFLGVDSVAEEPPAYFMKLPGNDEGNIYKEDIHFSLANIPVKELSVVQKHLEMLIDCACETRDYKSALWVRALFERFNRMDNHIMEPFLPKLDKLIESLDEYSRYLEEKKSQKCKGGVSDDVFSRSLDELMQVLDLEGKAIFNKQRHWIAVFRVAADYHLIGDNDYEGFIKWIQDIHPAPFRMKLSKSDLKQISNSDCYYKSFDKWQFYPQGNIKRAPYDKMVSVVKTFKNILQNEIDKAEK